MRKRLWLISVLALTAVLAVLGAIRVGQSTRVAEVGSPAPDFTLPDLDGNPVRLSSLRGQLVILNFWATWCPPCKQEMPAFQQLHEEMGGRVRIVGVDRAEPVDTVRRFVDQYGITFTIVLDRTDELATRYGLTGIPETFFLDANGIIRLKYIGPMTLAQMREFVRQVEAVGGSPAR
ncbi:TlpA family protein disulfide reductase [Caldinitratiruptor microaerophilus]|uniref:Thioredoxin domain-containing protein n=1 Tax=Caldinitratiruptor microaerophilus TaxID=671077 RepID=A0AA35CMC7_9FIRM|nr:redoxin domain-containing protein [Caldinitratiruptor microaerophilus]BDG61134.1 hypothetical protein caldi_22240 [Caldinitratiruptor microaerophilus]